MPEETEVREISFFDGDGYIIEQVAGPGFACYNRATKEITTLPFVEIRDPRFKLVPLAPETVDYGVVLLPTDAAEYDNEAALLDEIVAHIHKWVDVSEDMERFAAYYVLFSWLYDKFNTAPYLRVTGDTGSGKTRFLDTIGRICYKPILVSGAASTAPVFRLIGKWQGTLVLDEADFAKSDTTQDIVKILNSGFEKFRPVVRCDKENPNNVEIHRVFGPKVIASRYKFFDTALESRCLAEKIRSTRRRIPTNLPKEFFDEEAALRNKLLMYRFTNYDKEMVAYDCQLELEPRVRQMVASFLAILQHNPEMLKSFEKFIMSYQTQLIEERGDTYEGRVASVIHNSWERQLPITPHGIAEVINNGSSKHEHVSASKIGRIIRSLGLNTKLVKEHGESGRRVVYDDELLPIIFKRYIPGYIPPTGNSGNTCNTVCEYPPLQPSATNLQKITSLPYSAVTSVTAVTVLEMMSKWGADVCPVSDKVIAKETGLDSQKVWDDLQILSKNGEVSEVEGGLWLLSKKSS